MNRAVKRGLSRRAPEKICRIEDEKRFRKGHKYITMLNDINGSRAFEVVESRTLDATETLLQTLTVQQRKGVKSVPLDMWQAFATAVKKCPTKADIVRDRFYVSKYLTDTVDQVMRQESRQLNITGNTTLVGSKFYRLLNFENMTYVQRAKFDQLMEKELKTGVAWSIKKGFRFFWNLTTEAHGRLFLSYWSGTVDKSGLTPMVTVKDMLNQHRDNLLNYFKHWVSNTLSEGLNSKIQMIQASAIGFHNFSSYRIRILFYCGKLNMGIA